MYKRENYTITFVNYPNVEIDILEWLKKKKINIFEFDYCFFSILSSSHADLTLKYLNNIKNVSIKKMIYVIDYWKYDKSAIDKYIYKINPEIIFYAYYDNNSDFEKFCCETVWIPLAESSDIYKIRGNIIKKKEFLQFGRKNTNDFEKIKAISLEKKWKIRDLTKYNILDKINPYSFYYKRGSAVELSKLIQSHYFGFVSYSSLENKDKIGDISPITPRYYQIMMSGALPIGQFPKIETEKLFGDNIFRIELNDCENSFDKIEKVLFDKNHYINCVYKNYNYILKEHTYYNRVNAIFEFLENGKKIYK